MIALSVGVIACGDDDDGESSGDQASSAPDPDPDNDVPENGTEDPPEEMVDDRIREFDGIRVTLNEDGTILLSGVDRWGARLDTTYADATYFANAVPVLSRAVTDEQAAGLRSLSEELGGGEEEAAPDGEDAPNEGAPAEDGADEEADGAE